MAYKWKPSKTARREFAQKMSNDQQFASDYYERKKLKADKRRAQSSFDYETAGGSFIPTKEQHDFCLFNVNLFVLPEEKAAANDVMFGYSCREKVSHDSIHIVNEKRRSAAYV